MTDEDWSGWVKFYAPCFGLMGDSDAAMFAAWREVFEASGYTAEELHEAAKEIAKSPPRFRIDHLARIQSRIRERRFALRMQQEQRHEAMPGRERCEICEGVGWVVVPHIRFVADGEWIAPWPTMAVACQCFKGQAIVTKARDAGIEKYIPMALGWYEGRNPSWFRQLNQRETLRQAEVRAKLASHGADRLHARKAIEGIVKTVTRASA